MLQGITIGYSMSLSVNNVQKVAKLLLNAVFAANVPQYLNKHTSILLL